MYVSGNGLFRNRVGRSDFFFAFFCYTLLGDAHVGYFCVTKQNKQILHKQYRFLYCRSVVLPVTNSFFLPKACVNEMK